MSEWEKLCKNYPERLTLTNEETAFIPAQATDAFVTFEQGKRLLFANWNQKIIWCYYPATKWVDDDSNTDITATELRAAFPFFEELTDHDPFQGTAQYQGKDIQWNQKDQLWKYRNNRKVHFNNTTATVSPDDDDTATVEDLLRQTETTVTAVTKKLAQQSQSRPGTPQREKTTLPGSFAASPETSTIPSHVRTTAQTSSLPTPPVSKGKAPAKPVLPPVSKPSPNPPPPPGPNPPVPPSTMSGQGNPRPMGSPPEPYDGSPDSALSFWNALANYYTLNAAIYPTEGNRVAAALTHFKAGTTAGAWASDRVATALTTNYGTWNDFRDDFKRQFIPVQTTLEAIQKMHNYPMGNQKFNDWYLIWSQYARRTGTDAETKMFAFRSNLNRGLHQKVLMLSPQPTTLDDLVAKTRELDNNYQMFGGIADRTTGRRSTRIREVNTGESVPSTSINAAQRGRGGTPRRGRLTFEERKHRMDNNLCLYCGKPGHKAIECRAPPNKRPKPQGSGNNLRQMGNNTSTQETADEPQEDPVIGAMSANQFQPLLAIEESNEDLASAFL